MFNFTIDKQNPIPYYYQIEEWIRGLIASGQLKPGDMLPPEVRLSEQLEVSTLTVRQALGNLANEGLLIRKRAKGTFVAPHRSQVPFTKDSLRSMTKEAEAEGLTLRSRVLAQEVVPATGEIMRELHLAWGDKVILIRRVRSAKEVPIVIETCYFPYRRFPELLTMDLTDRSIYEILDKEYNALPQEALDSFIASVATADEASLLEINEGAPVMRYKRTATDSSSQPMELTKAVFRADRYRFVTRLRRSTPEEQ